jgi:transcriptional regulator with XRE-family HTH domain
VGVFFETVVAEAATQKITNEVGGMAKIKSGYGRGTGRPHPIDVHVGAKLRARRTLLGMNQTKLGDGLGVSFQQVQKYEKGTNRIGSSRLFQLTRALDVSIEYFFEDMPPKVAASMPIKGRGKLDEPVVYDSDPMAKRETLELVRAYYKIEDANVRRRLRELTKALGAGADKDS